MSITRRNFLEQAAVFSALGFAPRFLTQTAEAQTASAGKPIAGFKDDRILVVVQLGGGNDGINTLVPYGDDAYYRARPNIGMEKSELLRLNDYVAFHKAFAPLQRLYGDGKLAVVQGVGYPNPDRSHFRAMEIWQTASDSDRYLGHGWLGRYFDNTCKGTAARPQAGVAFGGERPQAFNGELGLGIAVEDPAKFGWQAGASGDTEAAFAAVNPEVSKTERTIDFLRHTTRNALRSSAEVKAAADRGSVGGLAGRGRAARDGQANLVAGLIRGGLDTRVYYISTSGFDTHAGQAATHENLLARTAKSLADFQEQLEHDGNGDRVLTMVFSEFGRRVGENASGGTDHGTAAPMFLMGKGVKGGLHGAYPSLSDLDNGDLKFTTDFRDVYAGVLQDWLGVDPKPVIETELKPLNLVNA